MKNCYRKLLQNRWKLLNDLSFKIIQDKLIIGTTIDDDDDNDYYYY